MRSYVVERLIHGVFVLFGISILVFLLVHVTGDPLSAILGEDATPQQIAAVRRELELDQPLPLQYLAYVRAILGGQGQLGYSLSFRRPAIELVIGRLPATLELTLVAVAMTLVLSFPLGIISAVKRGSWIDQLGTVFIFSFQSLPGFVAAIMLIVIFGVQLRWLPVSGQSGPESLVLPATALALHSAAYVTRLLRGALLEALGADYVRTADAKGLRRAYVVLRHALPNTLLPVVTATGIQFISLMGGAVIVETVFAWPGVGTLAVQAVINRDVSLVMASTVVFAAIAVVVTLCVDLGYGALDPRIKVRR